MKTENQKRVLQAFANEDNVTLGQVAQQAQISRKTLWNYLSHDRLFAEALEKQRQQQAVERAEAMAEKRQAALDTIVRLMNDESQPAAVRLRAATALLAEATATQEAADAVSKSLSFTATWG